MKYCRQAAAEAEPESRIPRNAFYRSTLDEHVKERRFKNESRADDDESVRFELYDGRHWHA